MATSSYPEPSAPATGVAGWIDERLGLSEIVEFARHKTVPQHKQSFWYYWGGISLILFVVQMFTGILLLVYYRPGREAFESVRQITYDLDFGWLVRSAHSWSANLMIFAVLVHLFSVYFMKAYRKPREFGWWSGLGLAAMVMLFGFSGYLLPMDQLAYFATKVGLQLPSMIPGVGNVITDVVRGGPQVSDVTVQRFFALHVVILPLLFLPLLGFHLFLVQRHGNAVPESEARKPETERRTIPFFPHFFAQDLAMWLIALNVVTIMATLYPWDLGNPADALSPAPIGIHPEWYFMSQFQMLKVFGEWLPGFAGEIAGMVFFTAALLILVAIPLIDPSSRLGKRARFASWAGIGMVTGMIGLTIWGYAAL